MKIALKFSVAAKDTARFTASWQEAALAANEKITLRLGDFVQTLTVDGKGLATGTAVRAKATSKKGTSTLKAIVGPGALAAFLAAAGLSNTDEKGSAEEVTISLTIKSAVYSATVPLRYKAKAGKTGSAKQLK